MGRRWERGRVGICLETSDINKRVPQRGTLFLNPLNKIIMNTFFQGLPWSGRGLGRNQRLFGVDDGFVDCIPTGCGDTPVVGGVFVAVDSDFASFNLFVSIDTHDTIIFYV